MRTHRTFTWYRSLLQVRDEIGSDTPGDAEFGVGSGIGMNGHVFNVIYTTTSGSRDYGEDPIGLFKGFCTVVSEIYGELLCTYEIYINANGEAGLGGVIVTGPVASLDTGVEFESIVTGAQFDFAVFNTGVLRTVQDAERPILFANLSLST
jgi:hypothetical protein